MTNNDENTIRARYREALKKYGEAQSDLATALKGMHGIGEYPPPPPRLRFPLDKERLGKTRKMQIGFGPDKMKGYFTAGTYSDGTLGEIFITAEKQGSFVSGLMDGFATVFSIALQSGVSLEKLLSKCRHTRFEPAGITPSQDIPTASSVLDYLAQWISQKFVNGEEYLGE